MSEVLRVGDEVAEALAAHVPVVALESTIFSRLGLPAPANRECWRRVEATVRGAGAVPGVCGVLDGTAVVGADQRGIERLLDGSVKLAARDLAPQIAGGLDVGVTTVSATVTLAAAAGIDVFATGGIGGVHRDAMSTGDISADLEALARRRLVVVSSGVKAFLDVPHTVERLETLGVAVLGWRTDRFPAFYVRDGGREVPSTVTEAAQVAGALRAAAALGHPGAVLVVNPVPRHAELARELVEEAVSGAEAGARRDGVRGGDVTPVVLAALAEATGGAVVEANIVLAESNAAVAVEIAGALVAG